MSIIPHTTPLPSVVEKASKRVTLTDGVRRSICEYKLANPKLGQVELLQWLHTTHGFKISQATMSNTLRRSYLFLKPDWTPAQSSVQVHRTVTYPLLDSAVLAWVRANEESGRQVTGDLMKEKARQFFPDLYPEAPRPLEFSNGWLRSFKNRHGIRARKPKNQGVLVNCSASPPHKLIQAADLKGGGQVAEVAEMAEMVGGGQVAETTQGLPDDKSGVHSFVLRPLEAADFDRGYLPLLAQLTEVGCITEQEFKERVDLIQSKRPDHLVLVLQNTDSGQVVASGTLLIENKIVHECGKVGHIEDLVVAAECRGLQLGKRIVHELREVAKQSGCYKVILDCSEANVLFYEKCGFEAKARQMAIYF